MVSIWRVINVDIGIVRGRDMGMDGQEEFRLKLEADKDRMADATKLKVHF